MNANKSDDIEARLERSLRNQVRAPQLDGRFDAAVWARIEKASVPQVAPMRKLPRWLVASNAIGVLVAIALVAFVGGEALSSVEIGVEMPQVAPGLVERVMMAVAWPITGIGRRLRAEFF